MDMWWDYKLDYGMGYSEAAHSVVWSVLMLVAWRVFYWVQPMAAWKADMMADTWVD